MGIQFVEQESEGTYDTPSNHLFSLYKRMLRNILGHPDPIKLDANAKRAFNSIYLKFTFMKIRALSYLKPDNLYSCSLFSRDFSLSFPTKYQICRYENKFSCHYMNNNIVKVLLCYNFLHSIINIFLFCPFCNREINNISTFLHRSPSDVLTSCETSFPSSISIYQAKENFEE